jgi:hypothetical protein
MDLLDLGVSAADAAQQSDEVPVDLYQVHCPLSSRFSSSAGMSISCKSSGPSSAARSRTARKDAEEIPGNILSIEGVHWRLRSGAADGECSVPGL